MTFTASVTFCRFAHALQSAILTAITAAIILVFFTVPGAFIWSCVAATVLFCAACIYHAYWLVLEDGWKRREAQVISDFIAEDRRF